MPNNQIAHGWTTGCRSYFLFWPDFFSIYLLSENVPTSYIIKIAEYILFLKSYYSSIIKHTLNLNISSYYTQLMYFNLLIL